jgi:hypothetical protein
LRQQALDQLIAPEEEVLVAIFKAIQPPIRRRRGQRTLGDRLDRDLNRRGDGGDLVATDDVTERAEVNVSADIADANATGLGGR